MEMKCKNANVIACDRSDLLPKTGTEKDGKTMKKNIYKTVAAEPVSATSGSLDVTGCHWSSGAMYGGFAVTRSKPPSWARRVASAGHFQWRAKLLMVNT
jgi:hypothetical protein